MMHGSYHLTVRARRRAGATKKRRSIIAPEQLQRPDRRADIIVSAEKLFAEHGYAAVSVRDIATLAGVPLALVGYYFGKKEELFGTVFEHRKSYIQERIRLMGTVDCSSQNRNAVEDLVRAWAAPVITLRANDSDGIFALLVARTAWDPGPEATEIIKRFYDPLALTFIDKMAAVLPDCDRNRIIWGYEYALGALLMYVADRRVERLSLGKLISGDPVACEELVVFLGAGFRALSKIERAVRKRDS